MLKITDHGATDFSKGISIAEAENVRLVEEINGERVLTFSYPQNDKSYLIRENNIVLCEGQGYRIVKTVRRAAGDKMIDARCEHIFNYDSKRVHIQNMPDMIGVSPAAVIRKAITGTGFQYISDSELAALGMRRVDYDGFLIDYFSTDKTNIYEVIKAVTECCGKGEIYADNYKIALVERIGSDTKIRLDLGKNMGEVTVERDIADMVTRLYPYGSEDLHIGSVNDGVQYLESPNSQIYGVREGYRDYTSITKPDELMRRALWEFDSSNSERIDVPCVNITGKYIDLSKLSEYGGFEKLSLGDGVTVMDEGNEIYERVIKIERSPYNADDTVLSLGRVKKDMFFYLEQIGALTRRYKKVSTVNGKVRAACLTGTVKNGVRSDSVVSQSVTADEVVIGTNLLSADSEGNLLLNGERIIKDTEETPGGGEGEGGTEQNGV